MFHNREYNSTQRAVPGESSQGALINGLSLLDDGGTGNYEGLLLSLQHRLASHFTVLGNYTGLIAFRMSCRRQSEVPPIRIPTIAGWIAAPAQASMCGIT